MTHSVRKTRGVWSRAMMVLGAMLVALGVGGSGDLATAAKPQPPRFVDNGNGTITDTQTGLMWEKKTGTVGGGANVNDPTNVDNVYTWSGPCSPTPWTCVAPDGTLFTDFLPRMNCAVLASGGTCGPGLHTDWRIPTIAELQTIVDPNVAGCDVSPFTTPCIDPIFGPTAAGSYWSSTSAATCPACAWNLDFFVDGVGYTIKTVILRVRAVRGGP